MHFREPGNQELAGPIDPHRAIRRLHPRRRANLRDAPIPDDDGLAFEHPIPVHGNDIDVLEGDDLGKAGRSTSQHCEDNGDR